MLTITEAAKALTVGRGELVAWLMAHKWCYRLGRCRSLSGYQRRIAAGDLAQKVVLVGPVGAQRARVQTMITSQGLERLSRAIRGRGLGAGVEGTDVHIRP